MIKFKGKIIAAVQHIAVNNLKYKVMHNQNCTKFVL